VTFQQQAFQLERLTRKIGSWFPGSGTDAARLEEKIQARLKKAKVT